jgi:hypothetical protein
MVVLLPRTRTISVRLSEREIAALEKFCSECGARSMSELARNAILGVLAQREHGNVILPLSDYSARVRDLEQKVEQLSVEISLFRRDVPSSEEQSRADAESLSEPR